MKNTDIELGRLYEFSIENDITDEVGGIMSREEYNMQNLIPYDRKTGYAHLIPKKAEFAKKYSDDIENKAKSVLREIKKIISNNKRYGDISCTMMETDLPDAIMFRDRYKKHGFEKTEFKNALYLFTYIRVIGESTGTNYDLMFNRFFIKDNKVNCILKCFQIEMHNISGIKNYPETGDRGYGRNIYKNYYNFSIPKKYKEGIEEKNDIDLPEKNIAKAFLDFVVRRENK